MWISSKYISSYGEADPRESEPRQCFYDVLVPHSYLLMRQEFLEDKCVIIPLSPPLIPMPWYWTPGCEVTIRRKPSKKLYGKK